MKLRVAIAALLLVIASTGFNFSHRAPAQRADHFFAMEAAYGETAKLKPGQPANNKGESWAPPDVDQEVPAVEDVPCPLPAVLAGAGERVQELVHNSARFTATEIVQNQHVDRSGHLRAPETIRFRYIVSIGNNSNGSLDVEEYRKGFTASDIFPDNIETEGLPSLVLLFHPYNVPEFYMRCEGLGQWNGQPAWQVHFEQKQDHPTHLDIIAMNDRTFAVTLRGRAWILADSYQIGRLETDIASPISAIRLRLQHEDIEYAPVHFSDQSTLWLPSSADLYMDFIGHQFHRRHSFTDFQLFSVKTHIGHTN